MENRETVDKKPHDISWRNTFNTNHKIHGWIGRGFESARTSGYPYVAWNGWVYSTDGDGSRIMLVEDLPS